MPTYVVYPESHLAPGPSNAAAYGICGVLPAALALVALIGWARDRVLAVRARAVEQSESPLKDGRTVVRGTVELARGAPHAVRVEVEQLGIEYTHKGRWRHKWTEMERRTLMQPFYVRDVRGQRIRIEPAADVKIVDDLDEVVHLDSGMRVRAASITPGEEVFVFGVLGSGPDPELADGYRGAGQGPVLRSPSSGGMLIATTSPAGRFRASAFVHGLWAVAFALLLGVMQLINVFHTVRVTSGETATGAVVSKRTYTTKGSKGSIHHHYEIKTRSPGGVVFDEEVTEEDWQPVKDGSPIALVQVPGSRGYEILGDRSTVNLAAGLVPFIVMVLAGAGYWYHRSSIRPWYERKVEEQAGGKLREESAVAAEPAIPQ
jgi:hypothetical protein